MMLKKRFMKVRLTGARWAMRLIILVSEVWLGGVYVIRESRWMRFVGGFELWVGIDQPR